MNDTRVSLNYDTDYRYAYSFTAPLRLGSHSSILSLFSYGYQRRRERFVTYERLRRERVF